jgi:hypothetical protein
MKEWIIPSWIGLWFQFIHSLHLAARRPQSRRWCRVRNNRFFDAAVADVGMGFLLALLALVALLGVVCGGNDWPAGRQGGLEISHHGKRVCLSKRQRVVERFGWRR